MNQSLLHGNVKQDIKHSLIAFWNKCMKQKNRLRSKKIKKLFKLRSHWIRFISSLTNTNNHKHNTEDCRAVSKGRRQHRGETLQRHCIVQATEAPAVPVHCTPRLTDFCFCLAVLRRKRRRERLRTDMHAKGQVRAEGQGQWWHM